MRSRTARHQRYRTNPIRELTRFRGAGLHRYFDRAIISRTMGTKGADFGEEL